MNFYHRKTLRATGLVYRGRVRGGSNMPKKPRKIRKDIKLENLEKRYGIPQPRDKDGKVLIRKDARLGTAKKKLGNK